MRRVFQRIIATIVVVLLLGPIARADQSASTSSSTQPQAAGSSPPVVKNAPAQKPSPNGTSTPGNAAAPKKQEAQKLNPIVVTATKIEQPINEIGTTITVVENSQIEAQKIDRVENVLREVPGVQVTQTGSPGSVTDVSIRGASAAQTLVLVDGVEVNAGATGSFDFANLTTDNLDRVEVLRGAGGSLYGSQAIGGVINVLSQEGEGAPKASLVSEGGNRATSRQVATVSGANGLGYSGALSYFSTEGFRLSNDNSDNLAGAARLDYHLGDDTVIRGFARYIASNVSLPNFSVFSGIPLNPTAHERNEFMLFKGEVEHHFSDKLVALASVFFVRQDQRTTSTPYIGNPSSEDDRIPDETRGGLIEAIYTWAPGFRTLGGIDFKDRWVRTDTISVFPNFTPPPPLTTSVSLFRAHRQEYAGYIEQEGSFFDGHILATGGFRVDSNSNFGEEVSPAWSVAIPLEKISTTLRGSYSEGFRAPSFNDLFFPNFGDPKLQPEVSSEYDGGFTTNVGERASFTATYFSRRVKNLIVAVPCPTCFFGSQAGNAGRVDTQGVEIVPSVTIVKGLTFGGNVTILDETHKDAVGSTARPLRVAKHAASALLQYQRGGVFMPHDRVAANVNYIFVGDRDDITLASGIANHAAYHRVDAVVSYTLGMPLNFVHNEEVFARVSNMMDRNYSEAFGFKAPPVTFVAGVKLDFE
jgi:vitamin B12 transporter